MTAPIRYTEWRSAHLPATMWVGAQRPGRARILPDGCMDLIWDGERILVAGPDTVANLHRTERSADLVAVRFDPGVAPSVLGVPAHALTDRRVDLADVWTVTESGWWLDQPDGAASPSAALERLAAGRLGEVGGTPAWLRPTVELLAAGAPVSEVADRSGFSTRHLGRLARERFGYGPKVLARILRLRRALRLLGDGHDLSWVAATAGYADYPHLFREVRGLTAQAPSSFQPAAPVA